MRCTQFEDRLNELLDERLPPLADGALVEHAARCPSCARELAAHEVLLSAVDEAPRERPGSDFSQRVLLAMQRSGSRKTSVLPNRNGGSLTTSAAPWRWISLAVAASLLVAFAVGRLNQEAPNAVEPGEPVIEIAAQQPKIPPADGSDSPVVWSAEEFDFAAQYARLARETEGLSVPLSPQQRAIVGDLAQGFLPVPHSVYAALAALSRRT